MADEAQPIIVIGAGVVGLSTALGRSITPTWCGPI
jgi:hypothetical protein